MIVVLAEPGDSAAHWLGAELGRCQKMPVEVVTPARLAYSPTIVHRMSTGATDAEFDLGDGRWLRTREMRGMINRMTAVPHAQLAKAAPADRDYAVAELHAFFLGWLASLECPLVNPPAPECLAGPWHSEIVALQWACQAGLGVTPRRIDADVGAITDPPGDRAMIHFVVDGQLVGPIVPAATRDALILFAHLWGARLVQIETHEAEEGQRLFTKATSVVNFPIGGAPLVRAIARILAP